MMATALIRFSPFLLRPQVSWRRPVAIVATAFSKESFLFFLSCCDHVTTLPDQCLLTPIDSPQGLERGSRCFRSFSFSAIQGEAFPTFPHLLSLS